MAKETAKTTKNTLPWDKKAPLKDDFGHSEGQEVELGHLITIGDQVFRHLKVKGFNPIIQALDILYCSRYFSIVLDKDYFPLDGKYVESSIVEIVTEPYAQDHVHNSSMPCRKEVEARIAKIVDFFNSHIKSQTRFSLQDLKDDYNASCTSDADKLTDGHLMPLLKDSTNRISPSDLIVETRGDCFAYPGPDLGQTTLHSEMLNTIKQGNFDPKELSACIHPQITLSLELDCHYTWRYPEALQMEEKMWMLEEAVKRINRLLNAYPGALDITPNIEYGLITCTLSCISSVAMKQSTVFASLPQDATFLLGRNILHDIKNRIFTRREKQQLEVFYSDHKQTITAILGEENHVFERKYDPVTDLFAKDDDEDWNKMRALFRITFEKTVCKLQKIAKDKYAPLVELRRLPNCTGAEIFDPSGFWEKQHQEISDFQQGYYRCGSLLAVPGKGVERALFSKSTQITVCASESKSGNILLVEVRKTEPMGSGTFAISKIRRGEFIRNLSGEELSYPELLKRLKSGEENIDDPLQVGAHLFIDLDEPSRLINHSCDPTSGIRGKNTLVAIRDIEEDEEITFDYSATVGTNSIWQMKCLCGTSKCRKIIGNVLSIPRDSLKYYLENRALQDFIIKQLVEQGRVRLRSNDTETRETS